MEAYPAIKSGSETGVSHQCLGVVVAPVAGVLVVAVVVPAAVSLVSAVFVPAVAAPAAASVVPDSACTLSLQSYPVDSRKYLPLASFLIT